MEIQIVDPGAGQLWQAFGISERRYTELCERIARKLKRMCIIDAEAKVSEGIVIIASCCDTDTEVVMMVYAFSTRRLIENMQYRAIMQMTTVSQN